MRFGACAQNELQKAEGRSQSCRGAGGGDPALRPCLCLNCAPESGLESLEKAGGDDGARTRDLCRDSSIPFCNSLILEALAAPKSIQNHPKTGFCTVNRTVSDLAPKAMQDRELRERTGSKTSAARARTDTFCAAKV